MILNTILVIIILLMLPFVIIKGTRLEKKYNEVVKKNNELEIELKLIKQENYYLKQFSNVRTDSVK